MTRNDILQATAKKLTLLWPGSNVYPDNIHRDVDGSYYVGIIDSSHQRGVWRQRLTSVTVEVRYHRRDRDNLSYNAWVDSMDRDFESIMVNDTDTGLTVMLWAKNNTARDGGDDRVYQYLFDVDVRYLSSEDSGPEMEIISQEEVLK